eukprot:6791155-Prymnesium_polylepis.1
MRGTVRGVLEGGYRMVGWAPAGTRVPTPTVNHSLADLRDRSVRGGGPDGGPRLWRGVDETDDVQLSAAVVGAAAASKRAQRRSPSPPWRCRCVVGLPMGGHGV